ncbi:MAG: hypothetical protein JNJ54_24065 [Myxococcaceae bacterium]|nr:hypothetical protein [Myxococcaceae bacterium]
MKLLLARPHDFIVKLMSETAIALGLEPVRLSSLDELRGLPGLEFVGAVVSLAPTSTVRASPGEVHAALRARWPTKPLVVTGLSTLASARQGVRVDLPGVELLGFAERPARAGAALYLSEADLRASQGAVLDALAAHLRVPRPARSTPR